jgi:tripartite motif-containing protein 71
MIRSSPDLVVRFAVLLVGLAVAACGSPIPSPSPVAATPTAQTPTALSSPTERALATPTPAATATSVGPSPVEFLWSAAGPGDLMCPWDMALDPNGRLWVADTCSSRFAIFNADGSFIEYWEHRGSGIGEFNLQRASNQDGLGAIAFAPDGSFYVLDVGNRRVEHFDTQRTFINAWGGFGDTQGLYRDPIGLAVNADGVVYVLDDVRNVVETYEPDGTVLGFFDAQLLSVSPYEGDSFALDPEGNAYIGDCCSAGNNRVRKFNAGGALIATVDVPGPEPKSIAIDNAGRLFVGVGPKIVLLNPDGTVISTFNMPGLPDEASGFITGIFLDGNGNGYVAEAGSNLVEKFLLLPPFAPAVTPSP